MVLRRVGMCRQVRIVGLRRIDGIVTAGLLAIFEMWVAKKGRECRPEVGIVNRIDGMGLGGGGSRRGRIILISRSFRLLVVLLGLLLLALTVVLLLLLLLGLSYVCNWFLFNRDLARRLRGTSFRFRLHLLLGASKHPSVLGSPSVSFRSFIGRLVRSYFAHPLGQSCLPDSRLFRRFHGSPQSLSHGVSHPAQGTLLLRFILSSPSITFGIFGQPLPSSFLTFAQHPALGLRQGGDVAVVVTAITSGATSARIGRRVG